VRRALVAFGCLMGSACTHHLPPAPASPRCVADVLYFGRNIAGAARPDSAAVSQSDWRAFVDDAFRRWIPSGSTEADAAGRYVVDNALVAESTKVVTVVHPAVPTLDAGIDSAIAVYRRRFKQESVGRVQSDVRSTLCESNQPIAAPQPPR
jgi:hypothetical protein